MAEGTLVRETYDEALYKGEGRVLDEIVAEGASVHIERLSKRNWMVIVDVAGETLHMNVRDLSMYERTGASNRPLRSPTGSYIVDVPREASTGNYRTTSPDSEEKK